MSWLSNFVIVVKDNEVERYEVYAFPRKLMIFGNFCLCAAERATRAALSRLARMTERREIFRFRSAIRASYIITILELHIFPDKTQLTLVV